MSGNADRCISEEETIVQEAPIMIPYDTVDRIFNIFIIGIVAFFIWSIAALLFVGVYKVMTGILIMDLVEPYVLFGVVIIVLIHFSWGIAVTARSYGNGRILNGLKKPFEMLAKSYRIARGKELRDRREDDWY